MTSEYPWLPFSSALDQSTLPSRSIDPLGLLANADRIAELMLPFVTNRMTRARLLTIAALAVHVSEEVRAVLQGDENVRYEARMAFERLAVSAIARTSQDPSLNKGLPGKRLVTVAAARREPVTARNYLSAPSINGPSGIFARLARSADLFDSSDCPGARASSLIEAWAEDQGLQGILASGTKGDGTRWMNRVVTKTADLVREPASNWPTPTSAIWREVGLPLQLDAIGLKEKNQLKMIFCSNAVRNRMLTLLKNVRAHAIGDLPSLQRAVLWDGIRPKLDKGRSEDVTIGQAIKLAEGMERPAELMQVVFDDVLVTLRDLGGSASPEYLLSQSAFAKRLDKHCKILKRDLPLLEDATSVCSTISAVSDTSPLAEELRELHSDAKEAQHGGVEGLTTLLRRHERTQQAKQKGNWILRTETRWILAPGTDRTYQSRNVTGGYLHPFRITSMYSMMSDVGMLGSLRRLEAVDE